MITFCVITHGKRPEKLGRLLASIDAQNIPDAETLIAYDTNHSGKLGKLRNLACSGAHNEILVVVDDDIVLRDGFGRGILDYPHDWNVMQPRVLSPDGSRYWDWRVWYADGHQRMIDYRIPDDGHICPPGCITIIKRSVCRSVRWSEALGFYQPPGEDIDYGLRLHAAGYHIICNPEISVLHDDDRYYQVGDFVLRRD